MNPRNNYRQWLAVLALVIPASAAAKVTEFVIESRDLLYGGAEFGDVGAYESLRGYARGELDPADPRNAVIVNLDRAPVNAAGRVEYRVDVEIHKPVDLARGNGTLLYDVVNRGNKLALAFGTAIPDDGFTLVWSGWQGELTPNGVALTGEFPIAENVVGPSREEFIGSVSGGGIIVGNLHHPAATLDRAQASLTVRENERDPRQPIDSWRYVNERQIEITHPGAPFDAGAIFEFIYPATDPFIAGIGFAAMRDVNSFLRFEDDDGAGNANPLAEENQGARILEHTLAMGISQSGRMLRHFLWLGFNEDEAGRRIFDGAMPIIPGSRKTWANTEFSQPGRWSKQHEDHLQAGDQFPFAYQVTTDPLTGNRDGVLGRCAQSGTCPKIAHVDGEFEVWGARGSLLVTNGDPNHQRALQLPEDVRLYMIAGTPHGGAGTIVPANPSRGICQNLLNPLGIQSVTRAIMVALNEWVAEGRKPPHSRYGSFYWGNLVPSDQASVGFPDIPGVTYNGVYNSLRVTDYSVVPPLEGAEYGVLVPRADSDGNSLAGIRLPALEAPIATYTGWNLRAAGFAENEGCASSGSFIPFAGTAAERAAAGDPRPSIQERYASRADYVAQVTTAARKLVRKRYLTPAGAAAIIAEAEAVDIPLD